MVKVLNVVQNEEPSFLTEFVLFKNIKWPQMEKPQNFCLKYCPFKSQINWQNQTQSVRSFSVIKFVSLPQNVSFEELLLAAFSRLCGPMYSELAGDRAVPSLDATLQELHTSSQAA